MMQMDRRSHGSRAGAGRALRTLIAIATLVLAAGCAGEDGSSGVADGGATDIADDTPGLPDGAAADGGAGADAKPTGDAATEDVAATDTGATDSGANDAATGDAAAPDGGPADAGDACPAGAPCDDGDPCTTDDTCDDDGACAGEPVVCDDRRDCTVDVCDETGSCAATLAEGWCLIDAVCVEAGEQPDGNPCAVCDPSADPARWTPDDDAACDDGDACTTGDHCAAGACVSDGAVSCPEAEACADFVCDAATGDCVRTPHGGTCDDGDACTTDDQCVDGACAGFEVTCEGGGACLDVSCDPLIGCVETWVEGPCDDADVCSTDDFCLEGVCVGGFPANCDDGNPCTDDQCHHVLGCDHQPIDSPCCDGGLLACDDGDPCTADDCDAEGNCTHEPFVGACDDGDACTEGDVCDEAGACLGEPVDCDDGNACTADSCDAYLGCRNLPAPGACDDGDPCTEGDECQGGVCEGTPRSCDDGIDCTRDFCDETGACQHELEAGLPCSDDDPCTENDVCDAAGGCAGAPRTCDDDNVCTADTCDSAVGCVFTPTTGACDDGDPCTTDDVCVDGACVGTPGGCGCQPELAADASKVTRFAIGTNGQPGSGLDVDGDPSTCAPPTNCSGGIDNSMAGVAGPANEPLQEAVAGGSLFFLFEHRDLRTDGTPYLLTLLTGDPVDEVGCDFQAQTCDYLVAASSFDEDTCEPRIAFDNATIEGTAFSAGGVGYTFPFEIPIQGLVLSIDLFNARIEGTATFDGDELVGLTGIIGGAVPKQQLIDAVNAIPDEEFPENISKDTVLSLLNLLITDDIDTDGDGTPDAASIGIQFDAIDANLVGIAL